MTHYCKCLNVNIHLILEKEIDLTDHENRQIIENERIRNVLINDLGFTRVKIGSSMAGVQCNINLLCTRDTLSYYKSIREGTTLEDEEEDEEEEESESGNDQDTSEGNCRESSDSFMNCQVISCQNCDMTCAFHVTDINRYYLNANMLHGSTVESLKNSDQYSKVFGLLPQHTLAQEQTVNINIDAFPSLRKLQLHMQKALMAEKTAMESRIEEFARKQRQQYMQFFKKTNTERTKVFLRAQHVIKYRRPDIQTRRDNIDTPQDIHTPTGSEFDENLMFGSDLGSFSSTRDDTRKTLDDEDSDLSDPDFDDEHQHQHQQQQQQQQRRNKQPSNTDEGIMDSKKNKSSLLISIDSPNSPPNKFKQNKVPSVAPSYKELMSQSYFFRNVIDKDNKIAASAMFAFDENAEDDDVIDYVDEEDEDVATEEEEASEGDNDGNNDETEDKPATTSVYKGTDSSTTQSIKSRPSAQPASTLYSSSVPVQIPSRNEQYTTQQRQLQLQLALEKQKRKSELRAERNRNDTQDQASEADNEESSSSSSADEDDDDELGKDQLPVSVSLAVNKQRHHGTNRTIRRRAEDDIFEEPQMSYIERYMTFRKSS